MGDNIEYLQIQINEYNHVNKVEDLTCKIFNINLNRFLV